MSCLYISVSLENDLLEQQRSLNGTYKYLKQQINGLPIWRSIIFDGQSDTKSNAIWKPSKNSALNGDWMIGEMEDLENPKIRGIGCKASPDKCIVWKYLNKNNNQWATSTASGINVKCNCAKDEKCVESETCPMALYLKDSMSNSEDPEKKTESEIALAKKKCFIPQSNTTKEGFCCSKTQAFRKNDPTYKARLLSKFSKLYLLCASKYLLKDYLDIIPS